MAEPPATGGDQPPLEQNFSSDVVIVDVKEGGGDEVNMTEVSLQAKAPAVPAGIRNHPCTMASAPNRLHQSVTVGAYSLTLTYFSGPIF